MTKKRVGEEVLDRDYYLKRISTMPTSDLKEICDNYSAPTAEQLVEAVNEVGDKLVGNKND